MKGCLWIRLQTLRTMKLLSYTYRKLALLLFLLMAVWGVLFYYAIIDEVGDETDDT